MHCEQPGRACILFSAQLRLIEALVATHVFGPWDDAPEEARMPLLCLFIAGQPDLVLHQYMRILFSTSRFMMNHDLLLHLAAYSSHLCERRRHDWLTFLRQPTTLT